MCKLSFTYFCILILCTYVQIIGLHIFVYTSLFAYVLHQSDLNIMHIIYIYDTAFCVYNCISKFIHVLHFWSCMFLHILCIF